MDKKPIDCRMMEYKRDTERTRRQMNARKNATKHGSRNTYKGVVIRKDLRLAIYLRDSFSCVYCLRTLFDAAPTDITLDHVVANADGGSNEPSNLVLACRACNCSRKNQSITRFAGPETRKDIRRLTSRSIVAFRRLAKAIIAGTTEDPRGN